MAEYIDREKMLKYLEENNTADEWIVGQYNADWIYSFIESQPTADVVEVKHSRWENISGFDVCNICGTSPAYCEPKPNNPKGYPPYCHNCGAKMDGERKSDG